jgi:hypothetical protein
MKEIKIFACIMLAYTVTIILFYSFAIRNRPAPRIIIIKERIEPRMGFKMIRDYVGQDKSQKDTMYKVEIEK